MSLFKVTEKNKRQTFFDVTTAAAKKQKEDNAKKQPQSNNRILDDKENRILTNTKPKEAKKKEPEVKPKEPEKPKAKEPERPKKIDDAPKKPPPARDPVPKPVPKPTPKPVPKQEEKPVYEKPVRRERGPSPENRTVVITPGNPRGLSPPPDRYRPGTVMVTPELPPPGPMFPPESTPRHARHLMHPPTPSRHRRRRVRSRTPRERVKVPRDFVDSLPPTPWSQHPDNGSIFSAPRYDRESAFSPRSLHPMHGSVVSRFTRTLVNEDDALRTPISSRWTFPRYNINPPTQHTFRTFPQEVHPYRYDATPKPPKTSWSRVPARGSLIAPPWSEKRLVAGDQDSETAKWVSRHTGYAAEYSSRPMWIGYDVETDSDILQTPQGPRRFIGQEPELTDTDRWAERNFGASRDWLDTPYNDGRYYQYDRRYMDADTFTEYHPGRDHSPPNPVLYNEKAESTSKWVNKYFEPEPILVARERRRHLNYDSERGHPVRLIPVRRSYDSESDLDHERFLDHRAALKEKERYKNMVQRLNKDPRAPESTRPRRGSDRLTPESYRIQPDRYDRAHDDQSMFTMNSAKSYSHHHPKRAAVSEPGWDRYRDYGKDLQTLGPPAHPKRENIHRWLSER